LVFIQAADTKDKHPFNGFFFLFQDNLGKLASERLKHSGF